MVFQGWKDKMSKIFREKWLESVERKNSVLCAGLDPAEYEMGRENEGLPEDVNKYTWALDYINAVAPFCAAIKPNTQYWKGRYDSENLRKVISYAKELDLVVIDDSKLADIGSTNDAEMFYSKEMGADAITLAPYAGNMEETVRQAHEREIGVITMCLMSNPEYEREKDMLVHLSREEQKEYEHDDLIYFDGLGTNVYVQRYIHLAHNANKFGLDGVVIGAPSSKNHIKKEEISKVRSYVDDNMLVLLPGAGKQGGEAGSIWGSFDKTSVIVNVSRGLMFPNGSNSSSKSHKEAAKYYRDMLNELRNVYHK